PRHGASGPDTGACARARARRPEGGLRRTDAGFRKREHLESRELLWPGAAHGHVPDRGERRPAHPCTNQQRHRRRQLIFRLARGSRATPWPAGQPCRPANSLGNLERDAAGPRTSHPIEPVLEVPAMSLTQRYEHTLDEIRDQGLFKSERIITGPQSAEVTLDDGRTVLNFCANNYLGLADHPAMIQAAREALDTHGFGMASVRFICGTQDLHKELEKTIADFFGTEDTILYAACFDANGGLFEPLLGPEDAIISDSLNHASIIDGVRLCKAKRYRYANCDM